MSGDATRRILRARSPSSDNSGISEPSTNFRLRRSAFTLLSTRPGCRTRVRARWLAQPRGAPYLDPTAALAKRHSSESDWSTRSEGGGSFATDGSSRDRDDNHKCRQETPLWAPSSLFCYRAQVAQGRSEVVICLAVGLIPSSAEWSFPFSRGSASPGRLVRGRHVATQAAWTGLVLLSSEWRLTEFGEQRIEPLKRDGSREP